MLAGKFVVETGAMMCDAMLRILKRVELFWGEEEEEEEAEADEEEEESPGIFSVGAFVRRGNESEAGGRKGSVWGWLLLWHQIVVRFRRANGKLCDYRRQPFVQASEPLR